MLARTKSAAPKRTSKTSKPGNMSVEEWQIALRREFGREQNFRWKNIGNDPIFSEFMVRNPGSGGEYRVAIRGRHAGDNYCSCPDFTGNTLGTCKHIEFVLAKLEKKRGGLKALEYGFHPPYSEVFLRYGAKREVAFRPGTECPPAMRKAASSFFDASGVLRPEKLMAFDDLLKVLHANGHEVRCYDDVLEFVARARDQVRLRERVDEAFPSGVESPAFQKLLRVPLYPYQRHGALFAARAGRCLIADDMGLGKTIQAIAASEILARTMGIERVLVVAPTSLKHQWKQEIEKFTGRSVQVVEGMLYTRQACYREETFFKIANYDVIHRDLAAIRKWAPDLIILDEAQRIKNWKTRAARTVKKLASPYAIVLTGTPLENRLEELHSIVEFVDRYCLGPLFRFLHEHQHTDECGRVIGYKNLGSVAETLKTILVRRLKQDVLLELPERLDKQFFVAMTQEQWAVHEENREIVARLVAKWRKYKFLSEADQRRMTIALQYMRMACNSTYLIEQKDDFGVKADELVTLLDEIFEEPDAKAVVFSQWLRTHELILRRIGGRPWDHVLFHGGVPGPQRKGLIRKFKEDPNCRLFLSTDAGGVGLNLQNASVVINMDQPWNPAVLEQRIGRVHRLGQHRPVRVVHFVAQGTIEHGMLNILQFKKSLFAGALDGGQDEVFLGGTKLKRFMESVESVSSSIPSAMPPEDTGLDSDAADAAKVVPEDIERAAEMPSAEAAPVSREEVWNACLNAGTAFLKSLGDAIAAAPPEKKTEALSGLLPVERDEATGRSYVKLPMPDPAVLNAALGALASFVERLAKP